MADTRISKIQVRQGNIADLPILSSGELGYALDERRLFIGNQDLDVGIGDSTNPVFTVPISAEYGLTTNGIINPSVYLDGVQVNASLFTIIGTTLTFNTPPASGEVITMRYNSEVLLANGAIVPGSIELDASASAGTSTNFVFDTGVYNTAFIDYSVKKAGGTGFRVGQLRIVIDSTAGTYYIDDQYNILTSDVGITFDGDITNGRFSLTYENTDTTTATFYYTYKLWKM